MQEHTPYTSGLRSQRPRRISVFDGQDLKKAMLAGAASLEEHREIINALNVFPVPDGDTGSNLYATVQAAFRDVINCEDTSAGVISARLAHGALLGARGNSGVIFSQILRGLAQGLDKKQTFSALDLALALDEAQRLAYRAVIKPVEGTILTVIRETAEAAQLSAQRGDDLVALMQEIIIAARQSVARTPELLPILKQSGVVDSGGQGLCSILDGDEKMLKVHTHTSWPGKILDYAVGLGSLLDINIENLQEQSLTYAAESEAEHAAAQEQPAAHQVATVAVVSGPGFERVFRSVGLTAIVPGG